MTAGNKSRLQQIRTDGLLTENFAYDAESRLSEYVQTVDYRTSYPMTVSYLYDTLDRVTDVRYPAQYGLTGSPRKLIQNSFDTASRLTNLKVDGSEVAGNIVYNASDQTESIKIGTAGANQVTENYTYDSQNGLLTNQKVQKSGQTLLDLSYDYNRNNSVGSLNGKTGHLTKITNNLDANKNREYEFDALGRLTKAKGGNGGNLWTQNYSYDRYGNRTNVAATGVAADSSPIPVDGIPNLSYNTSSNRITTAGFEYDSAGNQTRALAEDGTWLKYEYDAVNRLRIVKKDDGTLLQSFQYGSTNERLINYDYIINQLIIYVGSLTEYTEFAATTPTWTKSYTYLGENLLSTITPNGQGGETTEYNHPDRLGTRVVTNQTTGSSYEQNTLPFGTALNAESTGAMSQRFTSYERSARTGLDYALNRTYDSKQGRFTQVDPIGMSAVDFKHPQTLNLYNYCGNDPINHTDADGLFFGKLFKWIGKIFKAIMIAVAIFVAVAAIIVMPALAPTIGYAIFAKLFILSGLLLVQALAPPKIAMIVGIATGLFLNFVGLSNIGIITNIGQAAEKISIWQRIAGAVTAVGSVANNLAQSFGKGKKPKTYRTAQEAAVAFLKMYNPRSIRINREIGAVICKLKDNTFRAGKTQMGGPEGVLIINDCPKGSQLAGATHTHARWGEKYVIDGIDYNENFSELDIFNARVRSLPSWIATPSGDIRRYDPSNGTEAVVSRIYGRTRRR